jgi:hypothetical protein
LQTHTKRNTKSNVRKTKVYYVKVTDDGKTAIYAFSLFGQVVYVKVRYREKMDKNIFVWTLDPVVEKVALKFEEVTSDGEA